MVKMIKMFACLFALFLSLNVFAFDVKEAKSDKDTKMESLELSYAKAKAKINQEYKMILHKAMAENMKSGKTIIAKNIQKELNHFNSDPNNIDIQDPIIGEWLWRKGEINHFMNNGIVHQKSRGKPHLIGTWQKTDDGKYLVLFPTVKAKIIYSVSNRNKINDRKGETVGKKLPG